MSIILCNKLLCLTEIYILYELDKHIWINTVNISACQARSIKLYTNLGSKLLKFYDTLESKYAAVGIILCNKLLCLNETYILYELDKHIRLTTVKNLVAQQNITFL